MLVYTHVHGWNRENSVIYDTGIWPEVIVNTVMIPILKNVGTKNCD